MSIPTPLELAASWIKLGQPVLVADPNPHWNQKMSGMEFLFPKGWPSITADECDLSTYREGCALIAPCGWTFDVIDIDTKLGEAVSRASVPPEIETFGEHETPSGGYHLFVKKLGYSKNNHLTFAGIHVGDYLAGTEAGAGRAFIYLPGTPRRKPEYKGRGYRIIREVDLAKLIDSFPDPILESVVMNCGSSRDGEAGRAPVGNDETQDFLESFREQERTCKYGKAAIEEEISKYVPKGMRHSWYNAATYRVVALIKTGCCTLDDLAAIDKRLLEIMPEGDPSSLKYAIANTKPIRGRGCAKHRNAKITIIDWSDPAVRERENALGLVEWESAWANYNNAGPKIDIVKGIIQEGSTVCIFSESGIGKTLLAQEWAVKVARGEELLGQQLPPKRVMYVDQEGSYLKLLENLEHMGYGSGDDLSNLRYYSLGQWKPLDTQEGADQIMEEIIRVGAEVVFLDTLGKFFSGSENDAEPFLEMNRLFGVRVRRMGISLTKLDHCGKNTAAGIRGHSAKQSDLDTSYFLSRPHAPALGEPSTMLLERIKDRLNYGEKTLTFLRNIEPMLHHELVETAADMQERDRIEVLIEKLDALGVPVDMGRPKVKEWLEANGVKEGRTALLGKAIKQRKVRAMSTESNNQVGNRSGTGAKIFDLGTGREQVPEKGAS